MTFSHSKICLRLRHQEIHQLLLDFYRTLIRLRKEVPALHALTRKGMKIQTFEKQKTIAVKRRHEEDCVHELFSFSDRSEEVRIAFDHGRWQRILDSSSSEWGGPAVSSAEPSVGQGKEIPVVLSPFSLVLYRSTTQGNPLSEKKR